MYLCIYREDSEEHQIYFEKSSVSSLILLEPVLLTARRVRKLYRVIWGFFVFTAKILFLC